MSSITYLLIRHGEAEGNRERRLIGQTDVALSDLGRQQAEALADRLVDLPITAFISSDLQRAYDTVDVAATRLGMTVRPETRLREINNGEWNGLLPDEVAAAYPDMWQRYRDGEDVPRPGGERWVDVQRRSIGFLLDDAATRQAGDLIVIGTHGGPVITSVMWAAGAPIEGNIFTGAFAPASNASITSIELPHGRIVSVNDTGHLGKLATNAHLDDQQR
jgi:broad specificity phosphatase PhoE